MASLYTQQSHNVWKTWLLMTGFFLLVIAVGWIASYMLETPIILIIAVVLAVVMNVFAYWKSDKIVLKMTRARPADEREYRELHNIVENLSITAGLPKPRVYIIPDAQPNAFATGRNPDNAVVGVTEGLLERLNRTELEGVIAHELAHIGNRDILILTITVVLAGTLTILADLFIRMMWFTGGRRGNGGGGVLMLVGGMIALILAPIAATMIRMAVSRRREFLADASGALLTRYPEGLASALEKIARYPSDMRKSSHATAHLFFANPFRGRHNKGFFAKLFMTHPPVEERIAALRGEDRRA